MASRGAQVAVEAEVLQHHPADLGVGLGPDLLDASGAAARRPPRPGSACRATRTGPNRPDRTAPGRRRGAAGRGCRGAARPAGRSGSRSARTATTSRRRGRPRPGRRVAGSSSKAASQAASCWPRITSSRASRAAAANGASGPPARAAWSNSLAASRARSCCDDPIVQQPPGARAAGRPVPGPAGRTQPGHGRRPARAHGPVRNRARTGAPASLPGCQPCAARDRHTVAVAPSGGSVSIPPPATIAAARAPAAGESSPERTCPGSGSPRHGRRT